MAELSFHNKVRQRIGELGIREFETIANDIMRLEFAYEEGPLETNQRKDLGIRKGKPDAHIKRKDGSYIAFNHTTTDQRNVKAKILKNISDLHNSSTFNKILSKVVTCTNTPLDDQRIVYEQKAKEYNWDYDIYSIDRLTTLLIKHPHLLKQHLNIELETTENTKYYCCGDRIKLVRTERNLHQSEFIEFININSEKELDTIEKGQSECSALLLEDISNLTGTNINWLKHGKGAKYSALDFAEIPFENINDKAFYTSIQDAFFCLEPESMILFIIVEFSEYNLGLMEYKDALDFWNWIDEQGKIGGIYTKLKYIFEHLSKYEKSRIITKDQLQKLRTYNYFPIDIVNNRNDH